jgi:hypothetical protein
VGDWAEAKPPPPLRTTVEGILMSRKELKRDTFDNGHIFKFIRRNYNPRDDHGPFDPEN